MVSGVHERRANGVLGAGHARLSRTTANDFIETAGRSLHTRDQQLPGHARSIGTLEFRHRATVAAQRDHQCFDTLAALGTAATGGVDTARLSGTNARGSLLYLAVGQRVAKANIHGRRVPRYGGNADRLPTGRLSYR
jgi:hypothetical protein